MPDDHTAADDLGGSTEMAMPDVTPAMQLVVAKVVAAVILIIGVHLSPEQTGAITLLVTVAGALILHTDGKIRQARNLTLQQHIQSSHDLAAVHADGGPVD